MNRAPGPNDNWWAEHLSACGGSYTKVREPPGFSEKRSKRKNGSLSSGSSAVLEKVPKLDSFLTSNKDKKDAETDSDAAHKEPSCSNSVTDSNPGFVPFSGLGRRLGSSGEVLHATSSAVPSAYKPGDSPNTSSGGASKGAAGSSTARSATRQCSLDNFLAKEYAGAQQRSGASTNGGQQGFLDEHMMIQRADTAGWSKTSDGAQVSDLCPICGLSVPVAQLGDHFTECFDGSMQASDPDQGTGSHEYSEVDLVSLEGDASPVDRVPCPVCSSNIDGELINAHLDACLAS